MGQVFRAFDPRTQRTIAIKLLKIDDDEHRMRFTLEARALARVDHPHVVKLFEVGTLSNQPYLIMPLLEGKNLLEACGSDPVETKVRVVKQVVEGIQAVHQKGMLHRDIKPSNILVVEDAEGGKHPYVMDFGLALETNAPALTEIGQVIGTADFLSPEQLTGRRESIDIRTDIYALGVTAYQLVSGRKPFKGTTHFDLMKQIIEVDPPLFRSFSKDIPRDLEIIIRTCLEKDPAKRYQSARELSDELQRFLEGRPIQARPPSWIDRFSKWTHRNRTLASTLAASLALLVGTMAWAILSLARMKARSELANRFSREAALIVHHLQRARSAPIHDLRNELKEVRDRLNAMEHEQHTAGWKLSGSALASLGWVEYQFGNSEPAQKFLQEAWHRGEHGQDLALSLAELNLLAYRKRLHEFDTMGVHPSAKEVEALDLQYRQPAVQLLDQARIQANSHFLEGMLLEARAHPRQALAEYAQAERLEPWNEWIPTRVGACWESLAEEQERAGKIKEARAALNSADNAYLKATDIARSSQEAWQNLASHRMDRMNFEVDHDGDLAEAIQQTLEACNTGLRVNPDSAILLAYRSEVAWREGLTAKYSSMASEQLFESASLDADRAISLSPDDASAQAAFLKCGLSRASAALEKGEDIRATLSRAEPLLRDRCKRFPMDPNLRILYAFCFGLMAEVDVAEGRDPRPHLLQAEAQGRAKYRPDSPPDPYWGVFTDLYNRMASADLAFGENPDLHLAAANQNSLAVQPLLSGFFNFVTDEGRTHRLEAARALHHHEDPRPFLNKAEIFWARSLQQNPRFYETYLEHGEAALILAQWDRPGSASHLEQAWKAFQKAEALDAGFKALEAKARTALMAPATSTWEQRLDATLECLQTKFPRMASTQAMTILQHMRRTQAGTTARLETEKSMDALSKQAPLLHQTLLELRPHP